MCRECLSNDKIETTTTLSLDLDGQTIVIKNIPCLMCRACGEKTIIDSVASRLEEIVNAVKTDRKRNRFIEYTMRNRR